MNSRKYGLPLGGLLQKEHVSVLHSHLLQRRVGQQLLELQLRPLVRARLRRPATLRRPEGGSHPTRRRAARSHALMKAGLRRARPGGSSRRQRRIAKKQTSTMMKPATAALAFLDK